MPLRLINKTFTDVLGNATSVFKANAGDKVSVSLEYERNIVSVSSFANIFTINAIDGTITRNSGSWIDDGFYLGTLFYKIYRASDGVLLFNFSFTVTEVTNSVLKVTGLTGLTGGAFTTDEVNIHYLSQPLNGFSAEFYLNFISTTGSFTENSLIDNEKTMFSGNVSAFNTFTTIPQVGKKSGSFEVSNFQLKKNTPNIVDPFHTQRQFVTFDIIVPNILFPDLFIGAECLNFVFKFVDLNQNVTVVDTSNTGYFNEAFNSDVTDLLINNTFLQTVHYNQDSFIVFDFTAIGTSINQIEFGACYIALDEDYNLNKLDNQSDLLLLLKTGLVDTGEISTTYTSNGSTGYNVTLLDLVYTTVGLNRQYTGALSFETNTNFESFIDAKDIGNRRFIVWAKVGNTNTILFDSQLEFLEPVGVAFTPDLNTVINKNQNVDYSDLSTPNNSTDINIHDDLAFISDLKLDLTQTNENIRVAIIVRNTVTNQEFDLEQLTFDFSTQDLNFFIPINNSISNSLPSLSAKKTAYLIQNGTIVANEIPLRVYYPFLVRWEYWIEQINAIPFFVSQGITGKNWFDFINGDFKVYIKLTKSVNGLNDTFYRELPITDYEDSLIVSNIELFEYPSLAPLNSIIKGNDILVRATHTAPTAISLPIYGDITLETKEGFQTFWINTVYNTNLGNNPLKGISNPQLNISYPNANTVVFECLLDTTQINSNFVTLTSKISEDNGIVVGDFNDDFNNDFY